MSYSIILFINLFFIIGVKLLSFRFYIYTYICRRLAQLGVNRNRLQQRREGMKRAARAILDERARGKREGISRRSSSIYLRLSLALSLSISLSHSLSSLSLSRSLSSLSLSLFSHCTALLFLALTRMNCSKRRRRQPKFAAMSLL